MAKNRKAQSAGLVFGAVLKATLLCGLIVICCVGRVWQKKQIAELSQQYRAAENNLKLMRAENDKMKNQLAAMMLPAALMKRAEDFKLGLGIPKASSIWRLPEPAEEPQTGRWRPRSRRCRKPCSNLPQPGNKPALKRFFYRRP